MKIKKKKINKIVCLNIYGKHENRNTLCSEIYICAFSTIYIGCIIVCLVIV